MTKWSMCVLVFLLVASAAAAQVTATVRAPAGTRGRVTVEPLRADRLWLGGRRHRAVAGFALRWERTGEHPWLPVTLVVNGLPGGPIAPAMRRRHMGTTLPAQWLHAVHGSEVALSIPAHQTVEVLWADLTTYRDFSGPYELVADPGDDRPLGDRRALVLVHGLLWSSPDHPYSGLMQDVMTRTVARHPYVRALRRDYKLYAFNWPSFAGAEKAGVELARQVRALYPDGQPPAKSVVLFAHSMGGLVSRYAMNQGDFGDAVRQVFTMATPHRGTLIASLARCGHGLDNIVGAFNVGLIRNFLGFLVPSCAALDDLAYDDRDGALSRPDLVEYGVKLNHGLRAFNERDRYLDRVTALTGDCPDLRNKVLGLPLDYIRAAQGILGARFANSDPLVPRASGLFEDAPIRRACILRTNHVDWAMSPDVAGQVLERVADLD